MEAMIASLSHESRMEKLLAKVSEIVLGAEFNLVTEAFFEAHCHQFTDDEENRLEYTTIHQLFGELVESQLEQLGDDYQFVCDHFEEFLAETDLIEERFEALEVLMGLIDFG